MIELFAALPHTMFCVKNPDGRYVAADGHGQTGWYLTTKVLDRDRHGGVVGIVVVSVPALLSRGMHGAPVCGLRSSWRVPDSPSRCTRTTSPGPAP